MLLSSGFRFIFIFDSKHQSRISQRLHSWAVRKPNSPWQCKDEASNALLAIVFLYEWVHSVCGKDLMVNQPFSWWEQQKHYARETTSFSHARYLFTIWTLPLFLQVALHVCNIKTPNQQLRKNTCSCSGKITVWQTSPPTLHVSPESPGLASDLWGYIWAMGLL